MRDEKMGGAKKFRRVENRLRGGENIRRIIN